VASLCRGWTDAMTDLSGKGKLLASSWHRREQLRNYLPS
jgi:hypothetical protein